MKINMAEVMTPVSSVMLYETKPFKLVCFLAPMETK